MRNLKNKIAALAALTVGLLGLAACADNPNEGISVGLITKQETNSYWVTMRKAAEKTAKEEHIRLITATGSSDVDVAGQEEAFRAMMDDGVDGIMIAPVDSTALNPLFEEAESEGIVVITVDTPVSPQEAADAYFGTDNHEAGALIGEYAKGRTEELGLEPKIAMLNLAPGIDSGLEREDGFLEGFGIDASDPMIVASADTEGDREKAREALKVILADEPDVSVIYAVNVEAAFGALEALEDEGIDPGSLVLVTVDGSCKMVKDGLRTGKVAATSMQFPENMAREGIHAIIDAAHGGPAPHGYLNTGVQLIAKHPVSDVDSQNVEYGVRNCWGD